MSLQTPTTKQINDNLVANIQTTISQTIPLLPKSFIRVLANAIAAVYILLWKYAGFIFNQMFVSTASDQPTDINGVTTIPLEAWGELSGVGVSKAATAAELTIDITVTSQVGSLPSATTVFSDDNGFTYMTTSVVLLDAPVVSVDVVAITDEDGGDGTGADGNLEVSDVLSFVNPQENVQSEVVVSAVVTTAADAETTESYRQRILDRFQRLPQGGSPADYEIWATGVAGVENAYPYTGDPGEVNVYVESTTAVDPDGIPPPSLLDDVDEAIQFDDNGLASRRQLGAFVTSLPITRTTINIQVDTLVGPDQAQLEIDVTNALETYILSREPFIQGLAPLPAVETITQQDMVAAINPIVNAEGGSFVNIFFNAGGPSLSTYTLGEGEKAKANVVFV